jgi:hypothetical protein
VAHLTTRARRNNDVDLTGADGACCQSYIHIIHAPDNPVAKVRITRSIELMTDLQ